MLYLGSGEPVETPGAKSHLAAELRPVLPEVLSRIRSSEIQPDGDGVLVEMGRVIGNRLCVTTSEDDEIVFAQRENRRGLTRFVKHRHPVPCRTALMILARSGRGGFFIVTGWVGRHAAPEPWDRRATSHSLMFWNSHALVWAAAAVVKGTETTVCPWRVT